MSEGKKEGWAIERTPNMCPHCGKREGVYREHVETDELWYCSWRDCQCVWLLTKPSPHKWGDKVKEGYKVHQRKVTPWEEVPLANPKPETE